MKVIDSGMPEEWMWKDFFNINTILSQLQVDSQVTDLAEIGCGYGTFTIPASKIIEGKLYAFDIDKEMINKVKIKLQKSHIKNVKIEQSDILIQTSKLTKSSIDYVMLFNILHNKRPTDFLDEAHRILKIGGKVGIIHWRSDIATPRGPDLSIRPTPEYLISLLNSKKFKLEREPFLIEPYHFGLIISKI